MSSRALDLLCLARRRAEERAEAEAAARRAEYRERKAGLGALLGEGTPEVRLWAADLAAGAGHAARELAALERLRAAEVGARSRAAAARSLREAAEALRGRRRERERRDAERRAEAAADEAALGLRFAAEEKGSR